MTKFVDGSEVPQECLDRITGAINAAVDDDPGEESEPDTYSVYRQCPVCKTPRTLVVSYKAFCNWRSGTLIQLAFPDLSSSDREFLQTGTCDPCWKKMWAYLDEEPDMSMAQVSEYDPNVVNEWKFDTWWAVESTKAGGVIAMFANQDDGMKFMGIRPLCNECRKDMGTFDNLTVESLCMDCAAIKYPLPEYLK